MKRALLVLLAALLSAPSFGQSTDHWRPTKAQVVTLEAHLILPEGSAPLASYTRFYAGVPPRGSDRIEGLLLLHEGVDGPYGFGIVDKPGDWPVVNDGGCSVIHVTYDVRVERFLSVFCNGVA